MTHALAEHWNREALEMVGQAVRLARQRASMSQRGLAARAGVGQTTVSRLERGVVPGMGLEMFARVAMVLASDLFSGRLFPADALPVAMRSPLFRHGLVAGFGANRDAPSGLIDERPWADGPDDAPSGLTEGTPASAVSPPDWWIRQGR
ncbi:MAG: helix-turn-helix domain-containing protein [Chloroflexi bacterium]|nr:helix-turn-helix domain-containing protein [Chloroflexota bacterium]